MSHAAVPHEYLTFDLLVSSRTSEGYLITSVQSLADSGTTPWCLGRDRKSQDIFNTIAASQVYVALPMEIGICLVDWTAEVAGSAFTAAALI